MGNRDELTGALADGAPVERRHAVFSHHIMDVISAGNYSGALA